MEENKKKKQTKKRSPNFPVISLEQAIKNTEVLYKKDGRAGTQRSTAFTHLGYKGRHGVSLTVLSAMKKYGLIREEKDTIYLTREAEIIIIASDGEKRKETIKICALKPEIHKKLWAEYSERGLPSDATLRDKLIFNYEFNEKAVDGFIRNFRKSLHYAGIEPGEINTEKNEGEEMKMKTGIPDLVHTIKTGDKVASEFKIKDYLIPRKNDKVAILRLENPVTVEDIKFIQDWLNLLKNTITTDK